MKRQSAPPAKTPFSVAGRRRRLLVGVHGNSFALMVLMVSQLATAPVLIRNLGVQGYGAWLLLSTIPTYLALSDLGFANAAGPRMTELVSRGRWEAAADIRSGTQQLLVKLVLGAVLLAATLAAGFAMLRSTASTTTYSVAAVLLVVYAGLVVLSGLVDASYRAVGEFGRSTVQASSWRLLDAGAVIATSFATADVSLLALALLASRACCFLLAVTAQRRRHPWLFGRRPGAGAVRHLRGPALAYLGFPIGNAALNQGLLLVVGWTLDAEAVVVLATTRIVVNTVRQGGLALASPFGPELTAVLTRRDNAMLDRLSNLLLSILSVAGGVAMLGIVVLGPRVLNIWLDERVTVSRQLLVLLCLAGFLDLMWNSCLIIMASVNRHSGLSRAYLLSSTITVLAAIPLTAKVGVLGVAGALVVAQAFLFTVAVRDVARLTARDARDVLRWMGPVAALTSAGPIRRHQEKV